MYLMVHNLFFWPLTPHPPPPPCRCTPQRAQVSAGVGKPPYGLGVCLWMPLVNGTGNSPSPGRPTPGVVKQDKSSGGTVDTTKTRSDPQRVRMCKGQRPIGAAKGKHPSTMASCQPPPRRPLTHGLALGHIHCVHRSPPSARPHTLLCLSCGRVVRAGEGVPAGDENHEISARPGQAPWPTLRSAPTTAHVLKERGGGVWNPKVCVPKMARINISFCKFGSGGGGEMGVGRGGRPGSGGYLPCSDVSRPPNPWRGPRSQLQVPPISPPPYGPLPVRT